MTNTVITGIQWGDEGKGKIVDWLAENADVIVRFQGGNNAGHTMVVGDRVYKLSMLPTGVIRPGKLNVIGNGAVIDPWAMLYEIDALADQGVAVTSGNLLVAENAALVLPLHRELDELWEQRAGSGRIGTTGKGIGPAYEDKVGRRAIRVGDLRCHQSLDRLIDRLVNYHDVVRAGLEVDPVDPEELKVQLLEIAPRLLEFAGPAWRVLRRRSWQKQSILFEGAQGALLDIDHGTYPYVTSSSTVAGAAAAGSGVGPGDLHHLLGVCKAYTTRVGEGPFPTELSDHDGQHLATRGREFGTVTGRPRRCGWLDAVLVRQICELGVIDRMPATGEEQENLEPLYEVMPGWTGSVSNIRSYDQLPEEARNYIERIEELVEIPVDIISTSPDRNDTFARSGPFAG